MTTATAAQAFYAVRVNIAFEDGSTSTRDYVRGTMRIARDYFGQWALGNMLALVSDSTTPLTWEVVAIEPDEVR